ncbi:dTDP-4-dehydrorhamnose 3,5-epimerase family protein [Confluentibacter citreus]|uniref:dTDP-4-dehydrorhamnose 3,5-epimerase family protein n=1 Tax=Confluentibacter citreus TaxID=2007307 RepID=UPI000C28A2E7|nr:dTDP-4-dehydrorhamnose 3,5-epimerase family protein [Confluentibacter citreus]
MKIEKTELLGVNIIDNFVATDERGTFVKTFSNEDFNRKELKFDIKETYYSISKKNVIRGMHFQLPPFEHKKLVFVIQGSIIDVIVDLRKESITYKKSISIELSANNRKALFIPEGFAHGFKSLEDNTITVYHVSSVYNSGADSGIYYDSIDFDWELINPIISERDRLFDKMHEFKSPF